ncbi:hypothetical protein ALT_5418 [Aspergillus lentulus]|uniref:Uncharacterized protein n=1 Tax=Aspergillus lentulus TaxID=293939 RepID=A0AAN4PK31_ASPLE|nr:hypothetical protein ALT_5418 [Aspergillus lentulus]
MAAAARPSVDVPVGAGWLAHQMGEAARREAAAEFADTRSSCRILLTSYQCGAHGLNLHAECSCVILLEPSLNLNTLFQASMVMAAQAKDDGEDEEAADQAEAEVIQGAVVDCLRRAARGREQGRIPQLRAARDEAHQLASALALTENTNRRHRGAEVQPSAVTKQRADQSRNSALLHYEETEEPLPVPKKPATILTSHVEWNDSCHSYLKLRFAVRFRVSSQGGKKAKGKPQKNVATPPVFHNPINPNDGRALDMSKTLWGA